ncbi:acyl-CoA carboxylase subunit epsilon [soil metagenome]
MSEQSERTDAAVSETEPVLRVVRGEPSPEELAALLAVVLTRGAPGPKRRPSPRWSDRAGSLRRPLPTGPGAWRTSALP